MFGRIMYFAALCGNLVLTTNVRASQALKLEVTCVKTEADMAKNIT